MYLYYKSFLVRLSIMIFQCFSCIFPFIYSTIQPYWNAPEHVAVAVGTRSLMIAFGVLIVMIIGTKK
ncbi:hypothetical protein DXC96_12310 [Enterocloster bolteae]|nr:hypothetical protein DXC96_12310 [Enterocloster bolteae]